VQRRVYDSLNVLSALKIITKDYSDITLKNPLQGEIKVRAKQEPPQRNDGADKRLFADTKLLEQRIDDATIEVQAKQQKLLDLIRQIGAVEKLKERNMQHN